MSNLKVLAGIMLAAAIVLGIIYVRERPGGLRNDCHRNLLNIQFALMNYHDVHGSYPPPCLSDANGQPLHSWRVLLLPFMGHQKEYAQYDFSQPWNSPKNRQVLNFDPVGYQCPADPATDEMASYLAVVDDQGQWLKPSTPYGALYLIESTNTNIHWAEPRDFVLPETGNLLRQLVGSAPNHPHGTYALVERDALVDDKMTGCLYTEFLVDVSAK